MLDLALAQHGANADEDQVTNCQHDGELDDHHSDAEEDPKDTQSDAHGGQNEGNAHGKNKNSQKDDSYYSQDVSCFFHFSVPQFFPLRAFELRGLSAFGCVYEESTGGVPWKFTKYPVNIGPRSKCSDGPTGGRVKQWFRR